MMAATDPSGTLFVTADDGSHGEEVWKSDGTEAGTVLLKDIHPTSSSGPWQLTGVNDTLFFVANDGLHGPELRESDGTEAGTVLVKDINPGAGWGPVWLAGAGGTLFFSIDDGTHGAELWAVRISTPHRVYLPLASRQ